MSRSTNVFTKEYLLCRDRVGAMIFLLFCLCYGYQTSQIALFPGDEYEPFTARTLPTILTYIGIGLSLLLLVTGQPDKKSGAVLTFNWKLLISFLVLMALYGLGLTYLGFVLATGFFCLRVSICLEKDANPFCLAPLSHSLSPFIYCSLKVWISISNRV
ncbi:tripartite tricarboxylate transporter TctB family protein [Vibrio parahaemolyticus]|nr:tripartite tricarboxylate transporter TctB family protein [Vibrio parahaemolyticus]